MRLYLDTNILAFILCDRERLKKSVLDMFLDYSNSLYTSVLCVHELIHLFQIGKIGVKKANGKFLKADEIISVFDEMSIRRIPITDKHLQEYANLPFVRDHRDPFDRLIIAQAISDKAYLVSSDLKFPLYSKLGLQLIMND